MAACTLEKYGFTPEFLTARGIRTDDAGITIIPGPMGDNAIDPDGQLLVGNTDPSYGQIYTMKDTVFYCASLLDAVAIDQAGGKALLIYAGLDKGIETMNSEMIPGRSVIVIRDGDQHEAQQARAIFDELKKRQRPARIVRPTAGCSSVLEMLQFGQGMLQAMVQDNGKAWIAAEQQRRAEEAQAKQAEQANDDHKKEEEYRESFSTAAALAGFSGGAHGQYAVTATPTGFDKVDQMLSGGLYPSLYVLGAGSSMGKSDFAIQLGEQLAKSGQDVLYFSTEMPASEIVARWICRNTYRLGGKKYAREILDIMTDGRYSGYDQQGREIIDKAVDKCQELADRFFIYDALEDMSADTIADVTKRHAEIMHAAPIVIVDYLQMLAPKYPKGTDKQNVDYIIHTLKGISRAYKIPLFAISSFSRSSYNQSGDMAAYKGSGDLEYTGDVLLSIEPDGMTDDQAANKKLLDKIRWQDERRLVLKVLKQRNARARGAAGFVYNAKYHAFSTWDGFTREDVPEEDEPVKLINPFR